MISSFYKLIAPFGLPAVQLSCQLLFGWIATRRQGKEKQTVLIVKLTTCSFLDALR